MSTARNFETALEKNLWAMLYRSQQALAVELLAKANQSLESENDWPAGQQWHELGNTSQAAFSGRARELAGIDHKAYLALLRENQDALAAADSVWQYMQDNLGEIPPVDELEAGEDAILPNGFKYLSVPLLPSMKRYMDEYAKSLQNERKQLLKEADDLSQRRLAAFAKQNDLTMPEDDHGTSE